MNPERWRLLKGLFADALEKAEEERSSFLAQACAGDAELRAEVESLLASHQGAGGFLDGVTVGAASAGVDGPSEDSLEREPQSLGTIGPYQLLRRIGRGGMGMVYLAERVDREYRRRVAIKLVRRGMDSEYVVSRFRNERQILAGLAHPNIASLLDGGTTEGGLPYFVMEYIDGEPIDRYCDARRLPVSRRLELFLSICDAVQYAHRSLVVHRDLKPGNILVTREGVPKLLDFGIAKILDSSRISAEETSAQFRFVTPAFASPEQILGGAITTASDVFSLGVLLYLLLTGRRPFEAAGGGAAGAARATCEVEPARPSAVVLRAPAGGDAEPAGTAEALGAAREGTPDRLRRRLAGDLDTIVLTAMRREPERRYASVERLADDIRRHLSGRPVSARPASVSYRAGKFISRHRVAVLAGALVVLSVAGGFVESSRQRARAERRFADVRKLANSFLFEFHDAIRDLPGATRARALVVQRAEEYLDSLAHEAEGDLSIQRELADAYRKLGEVQGSWTSGLGDLEGSMASLAKAVAILERIHAVAPDARSSTALGEALAAFGFARATAGDRAGLDDARRGVRLVDEAAALEPGNPAVREALARTHQVVGMAYAVVDEDLAALPHYRKAVEELERIVAADPKNSEARRGLAKNYYYLATISGAPASLRRAERDPVPAAEMMRKAIAINEERLEEQPASAVVKLELAFSHIGLGVALEDMERVDAALESFARALALRKDVAAADAANAPAHLYVAETHLIMGGALEDARRPAPAIEHLLEAAAIVGRLSRADPNNTYERVLLAQIHSELGRAEMAAARQARPAAAAPHWRSARAWYAKSEDGYGAVRAQGKLTADRARDSDENVRQIAACDAALVTGRAGAERASSPAR